MRRLLSAAFTPARRYVLRRSLGRIKQVLRAAAPWIWAPGRLKVERAGTTAVVDWTGRPDNLGPVAAYLNAQAVDGHSAQHPCISGIRAFDFWRPGTFKVPVYLDAVIDLSRPYDETLRDCNENIRRVVRRHAGRVEVVHVRDPAAVEALNHALLRPFAEARHGSETAHVRLETVQRFARGDSGGRVTALYSEGVPLACHVGFESCPRGIRTWNALRFGYAQQVFEDPRLLDEFNTVNLYWAAVWAFENGFAQYNIGASPGQPDGGLLQWKCRRGARVDVDRTERFFYLDVPMAERPRFLWASPIYFENHGSLGLALGVPDQTTLDDVINRWRRIVFHGVSQVQIYCSGLPDDKVRVSVERLIRQGPGSPQVRWNPTGHP